MFKETLDRWLIYSASFLRTFTIGMIAVLLAIFLMKSGFSKTQIGIVVSVGLIGAATGNLLVTLFADRFGRRRALVFYAALSAIGAVSICFTTSFFAVLIAAFFGMINARGKDRGAACIIETAVLPGLDASKTRTKSFAMYALVQDIGLAIGGIAAGLPTLLSHCYGLPELISYKFTFGICASLMLLSAILYLYLSPNTEVPLKKVKGPFSLEGKKVIAKISGLFALDSMASGFLTSALLAYYFYERFGIQIETLGLLFFFSRCLNAASYFGSVWLSKRIGLLRSMVFTHTPSHFLLVAIALSPTFPLAVVFFLLRESLVEMDVPTRQSYVMAIVKPEERVKAAGITQTVRLLGWAIAPAFAGLVMHNVSIASPLFIGAGIKITYDMLLYLSFRKIKPPEEKQLEESSA